MLFEEIKSGKFDCIPQSEELSGELVYNNMLKNNNYNNRLASWILWSYQDRKQVIYNWWPKPIATMASKYTVNFVGVLSTYHYKQSLPRVFKL